MFNVTDPFDSLFGGPADNFGWSDTHSGVTEEIQNEDEEDSIGTRRALSGRNQNTPGEIIYPQRASQNNFDPTQPITLDDLLPNREGPVVNNTRNEVSLVSLGDGVSQEDVDDFIESQKMFFENSVDITKLYDDNIRNFSLSQYPHLTLFSQALISLEQFHIEFQDFLNGGLTKLAKHVIEQTEKINEEEVKIPELSREETDVKIDKFITGCISALQPRISILIARWESSQVGVKANLLQDALNSIIDEGSAVGIILCDDFFKNTDSILTPIINEVTKHAKSTEFLTYDDIDLTEVERVLRDSVGIVCEPPRRGVPRESSYPLMESAHTDYLC